jgi:hypothetical protein
LELTTIQKIIGRQTNKYTQKGSELYSRIFVFGFMLPYFLDILIRNEFNDDFSEKYTALVVLYICRALAAAT